jgi:hypothetical protein
MSSIHLNMNFNFQQIVDMVKQLSPNEKLKLSDVIWDENMDIPSEHKEIVLDRIKKSKKNPERMLDWDKVSKKF